MSWLQDRYDELESWASEKAIGVDLDEMRKIDSMPPGPAKVQAQRDFLAKHPNVLSDIQGFDASDAAGILWDEVKEIPGEIGDLSLNFVRGLGAALGDGVDGAYDAVRGKLRGKEPDVIAGITVAAITILTVVLLYNGATNAMDVF